MAKRAWSPPTLADVAAEEQCDAEHRADESGDVPPTGFDESPETAIV